MTDFFSTNSFDLAVYACLFVAVAMRFMTGLLRSLATIIGYICGAGIAVAATPKALALLANPSENSNATDMDRRRGSVPDCIAGTALGAVRFAMLAIMLVLVFDRMIPPGREPAFLRDSQWRLVLSSAGQYGIQALPPEAEEYIDRLKRQQRL